MLFIPPAPSAGGMVNSLPATPVLTGNVITSGAINTKGTYATLLTTTSEVYGFWLTVGNTGASATRTDSAIDIAIGASQQNIIVPDLLCGWRNTVALNPMCLYFPIRIPASTLVSCRSISVTASRAVHVQMFCITGTGGMSAPMYSGCDCYGLVANTAGGTSVTPGASAGTEGTWTNVGSTTTKTYKAALVIPQGTLATTTMTALAYHWELGISSTAIAEFYTNAATTEMVVGPFPGMPIPCNIPSGAQLQVRAEPSAVSPLAHDVCVYCFY